ncbi:unnamed protein product, partial [Caenorhabditis auriculariae]
GVAVGRTPCGMDLGMSNFHDRSEEEQKGVVKHHEVMTEAEMRFERTEMTRCHVVFFHVSFCNHQFATVRFGFRHPGPKKKRREKVGRRMLRWTKQPANQRTNAHR